MEKVTATETTRDVDAQASMHGPQTTATDATSMSDTEQVDIVRQLASLQLPHMPPISSRLSSSNRGRSVGKVGDEMPSDPPTLRILVVADMDLASASALAELALAASDDHPLQQIDLCIACGPFCAPHDLQSYYQGRQRRRHKARFGTTNNSNPSAAPSFSSHRGHARMAVPPMPQTMGSSPTTPQQPYSAPLHPFKRTREETAALEGLMTAALSQLESIVCRVVFVPGRGDPITTLNTNQRKTHCRLTPNSRNLHRQWMPLAPGLGCAGLLHLDWQTLTSLQQEPPPLADDDDDTDFHSDSSVVEETSSVSCRGGGGGDEDRVAAVPSAEEREKQYGTSFCNQLEELVQKAPPVAAISDAPSARSHDQITNLLQTKLFQSILVTQFYPLEHIPKSALQEDETENISEYQVEDDLASYSYIHESFSQSSVSTAVFANTLASPTTYMSSVSPLLQSLSSEDVRGGGVAPNPQPTPATAATTTEFVAGPTDDDHNKNNNDIKKGDDLPWPPEHKAFLETPVVKEHAILHIAGGPNKHGAFLPPQVVEPDDNDDSLRLPILLPGSLRERGDFCVVDVAFQRDDDDDDDSSSNGNYRWQVQQTRFESILEVAQSL